MKNALTALALLTFFLPEGLNAQNGIEDVLEASGNNRKELQKTIDHFSKDVEKHKAALFLIGNLEYHSYAKRDTELDAGFTEMVRTADRLYLEYAKGKSLEDLKAPTAKEHLQQIREKIRQKFDPASFSEMPVPVVDAVGDVRSEDLIAQVEHGFWLRKNNPNIKKLSFDSFVQYILPFENTVGIPFRISSRQAYDFFAKYLLKGDPDDLTTIVERYVVTLDHFREILGDYPFGGRVGFEEVLFKKVGGWNCFDVSAFGAFILNAVGVPTAIEYYGGFKTLPGRHSYNRILEEVGLFTDFSLEGSARERVPRKTADLLENDGETMNRYRIHYGLQPNNPYSLSGEDEAVPEHFLNPLITEVTAKSVGRVYPLSVPAPNAPSNKIVFQATMSTDLSNQAMTWGTIDPENKTANFANVVADRLYFPMCFNAFGQPNYFAPPFMLKSVPDDSTTYRLVRYGVADTEPVPANIDRTKPVPDTLLRRMEELRGCYVLGADNPRFENGDTLLVIDRPLKLNYQVFSLDNTKPYRYYRFYQPKGKEKKRIEISEIQFLTDRDYRYANTTEPIIPVPDAKVRLLEAGLSELRGRREYDDDFSTIIGYPSLTFPLKEPQIVTDIIIAPFVEDKFDPIPKKGIGYSLYVWKDGLWTNLGTRMSDGFSLDFGPLAFGSLYVLKNEKDRHKLFPFTMDSSGNMVFLY